MPRQMPRSRGIVRIQKSARIHAEVERNLQMIADAEDKTFSWVVAEIVYAFFGLRIGADDVVKIGRSRRKKAVARRDRAAGGGAVGRKTRDNILRFKTRGNEKRIA